MKIVSTLALGIGLTGVLGLAAIAQDKKGEAPKLDGKYTLTSGKKDGGAVSDDAKKGAYTISADKFTIESMGLKFVMGYKLDAKATPVNIDMEILEGPDGAKGLKALGIVELKGDVLKLAYSPILDKEKDMRPKDFEGKKGFSFELKKAK
jgi:uncharacterized protein (TIGR03067 family)